MRRFLIMFAAIVMAFGELSAEGKTLKVNVKKAGTLSEIINTEQKNTITDLRVSGYINEKDMSFIREMAGMDAEGNATKGSLQRLDLSKARVDETQEDAVGFTYLRNTKLKELVLGTMRYLQWNCFSNMPNLETFIMKGDLLHIDGMPFVNCPKLRTVVFERDILDTGGNEFAHDCPELESITINNILSTGFSKVENCPKFKGCKLKGSVAFDVDSVFIPSIHGIVSPKAFKSLSATAMKFYNENDSDISFKFFGNGMLYNLACLQAFSGKHNDMALKTLRLAVKEGCDDYSHISEDTDLKHLHGSNEFNDIVALAKQVHINNSKLTLLKKTAPYVRTEKWDEPFRYAPVTDANLQRVRKFFNLDSIAGKGDEISQIKNIMYWLHNNIRHDGSGGFPKDCQRNAIDLFNACKTQKRGLNCRGLAIVLSEMYLAMGWPSRFLTCQPKAYDTDQDCHVINIVWSQKLNKWIWMDPTFAAYITDENGLLLHPGEVRERMIDDKPLVLNSDANWNNKNKESKEAYFEYMAKNLYILSAYTYSCFNTEGGKEKTKYVTLLPENFNYKDWCNLKTNNDEYFWQKPEK
jgi:hypothetical protein